MKEGAHHLLGTEKRKVQIAFPRRKKKKTDEEEASGRDRKGVSLCSLTKRGVPACFSKKVGDPIAAEEGGLF